MGSLLEQILPNVLEQKTQQMSWLKSGLKWLVGKDQDGNNGVTQLVNSVERFTGSKAATAEQAEKQDIRDKADQAGFDKEVTQRWKSDSEAPITRLVRPVSYLFVTFCVFFFGALDASLEGFKLGDDYVDMYKDIYIAMTLAYFGSRGYEKAKKYANKKT